MLTHLQQREIFHLMFLRHFCPKVKTNTLALKGGSNLRFFFNSPRYSEDMDLDIKDIETFQLKDLVMTLLESSSLALALRPFQIEKIVPPNIQAAKQTDTTQRFKVHLITSASQDLFTKIEFSKRRLGNDVIVERVRDEVLAPYKLHPLQIPHYPAQAAFAQKIKALAERSETQARDIFDLFLLSTFIDKNTLAQNKILSHDLCRKAQDNIFKISFDVFRDTVIDYLNEDEKSVYQTASRWEELQLNVSQIIESIFGTQR